MGRSWLIAGGVATLAFILVIVGVGGGGSSPPPIVVSDAEVEADCFNGTFVPGRTGWAIEGRRPPRNWKAIETAHGAVQADRGAVEVTIRPREGQNEVTLTGIEFKGAYYTRPQGGAVFYRPCGRRLHGAQLEVDLDPAPPQRLSSDSVVDAVLKAPLEVSRSARPIRFPWTVSLAHPLHLYLVVNADDSYCVWSARLSWKDGAREGSVAIDNGGRNYRIVDTIGVGWNEPQGMRWVPTENPAG
jgi:hypothetical protein